ncbi:MAG: TlpA family protein disulfide reductase [Halobacteriovoraceae bacterium]|nr:TlpA family protein disulfide reductase [Halobacteriovoraceae bacterium]
MAKRLLAIVATMLIAFGYAFYTHQKIQKMIVSEQGSEKEALVLKSVPDANFERLNGEKINLRTFISQESKKYIFVHFWGTWCAPCEVEFPALLKFIRKAKAHNANFYLVAVNDEVKKVKKFLDRFKSEFETLGNVEIFVENNGEFFEKFGTAKVPETYVFESQTLEALKKFVGPQEWENVYYLDWLRSL